MLDERRYRQEEETRGQRPSDEDVIIAPGPDSGAGLPENALRFTLQEIRFDSSSFISTERLLTIGRDYVEVEIGFEQLNAMIERINAIYRERGIVSARAVIPPQTIQDGILYVRLVEGRLGQLLIDPEARTRFDFLSARLPLTVGEVVDVPALRHSLNWVNSTSELRLQAALKSGENPGETDVLLEVLEPSRYTVEIFADNNGSESTGEYRVGTLLGAYGLLGRDDRVDLYLVGSNGSTSGLLNWNMPFNTTGGRVHLSLSEGDIEVVEGPFTSLDIEGSSSSVEFMLKQPFIRHDQYWLDGWFNIARMESVSEISGESLSEFEVESWGIGGLLQGFEERFVWRLGQGLRFYKVKDMFEDQTDVTLLQGDASLVYALNERLTAIARAGWQLTDLETVPSPVLFQLGGVNTVRGYSQGVVAGAKGLTTSFELHYRFNDRWQGYTFADYGRAEDISPDSVTLSSLGVGVKWFADKHLSAELSLGIPLEDVVPDQDSARLHTRISYRWH
ncbi:ShlB/FhaC/HecB family hemolysin secretion/activation protein [Marinobacterium sediminicola]|uniref:ShlB/FhaC/HecB family hemolysin secretion/activation protein n=1 Tax=Marinobacterium sediminicola TaxID=518898 RepID=UPI001EF05C3B|nr:ShlB/FhaC/HecB family hemolysin secretion/activation protein [Marinobacterium sediminicola]ULG69836.1 BamA/TamA family outer membrane protein [Marinobacterium sediminicola]